MGIEAINATVQPRLTPVDELHQVKLAAVENSKKNGSALELPAEAVKETGKGQEEGALKDATERVNKFVQTISQELSFSVDKDTNRTVVKVMDKKTGDVIRQIPSQEMLEIAKALDTINGLIIRKQA